MIQKARIHFLKARPVRGLSLTSRQRRANDKSSLTEAAKRKAPPERG
jgi:hypothetical protein